MSPGLQTLAQVFADFGPRSALLTLDGRAWSYRELWDTAQTFGSELAAQHCLQRGHAIIVGYEGALSAVLHLLAAARHGWRICPLPPAAPDRFLRDAIALVRPRAILMPGREALPPLPPPAGGDDGALDDGFLIALTSGSTGTPKAIQHTLTRYVGSAQAFGRLSGFDSGTRLYHVLPWVYMAGIMNAWLAPLVQGATIIEGPAFSPLQAATLVKDALARQANVLSLVPIIASAIAFMTRDSQLLARVGREITQVQCTSAPIPQGLRSAFLDRFHLPLRDCYGITEVGGPVSLQTHDDALQLNEFSTPSAAHRLGLADASAQGQELLIASPFCMLGYLSEGRPDVVSVPGEWFPTGDLAVFEAGRMRITGRIKDLVIRGGYNVSPQAVESVVSACPVVKEVAAVGYETPMTGERLALFVALWDDTPAARQSLQDYLARELGKPEQPDRLVVVGQLPRLYNGKLDKPTMRQLATSA